MTEPQKDSIPPETTPPEQASPAPSASPGTPPEAAKPSRPEKRPLSLWKRLLRGLLGILILIGLGAILVLFTLYMPLRQNFTNAQVRINELTNQASSDLEAANQEIDRLSSLETQNKDLQSQLAQSNLHLAILQVQVDIASAQLALANQEPEKARLALTKTPDHLQFLEKQLPQDQRKVITDLQARLELVLGEIDENGYAASSDLDVMSASLLELENALIP
ncbi:MAG: hypothetical protein AB1894_22200 [Chloroflexota bacterium]